MKFKIEFTMDYWSLANENGQTENKPDVFRRRIGNILLDIIKIASKFVKGGFSYDIGVLGLNF